MKIIAARNPLMISMLVAVCLFVDGCLPRPKTTAMPVLAGTSWEKKMSEACSDLFFFNDKASYDFYSCELDDWVQGQYSWEGDSLILVENESGPEGHVGVASGDDMTRYALLYTDSSLRFLARYEKEGGAWKNTGFRFAEDYVFRRAAKEMAPGRKDPLRVMKAPGTILFRYQNDSLRQVAEIDSLSPAMIRFSYMVTGVEKNEFRISGTAQLKEGDLEIDEDEAGNAVAVEEYVYEQGDCYLAFRIDADTRRRMTVSSGGCSQKGLLPLAAAGILKRQ